MSHQLRATLHIKKVLKAKGGITIQLDVRSRQRNGVKLEITISMLGDFESGKSSIVGAYH